MIISLLFIAGYANPSSDIVMLYGAFLIALTYLLIAVLFYMNSGKPQLTFEMKQTIDIIVACLVFMGAITLIAAIDWDFFFKFFVVMQGSFYICEISTVHMFSKLLPNEERVEFMEFNPLAL